MIEWVIVFGSVIAFIAQYVYILGKLTSKLENCESNVTWIRNFLLTKCTDSTQFTQESDIKVNEKLKGVIPLSWSDTLDGANIDIQKCRDAFDCVIKISDNQGMIRLKKMAEKLDIPFNDFLLSSGIHLFGKKNKKMEYE